MALSANTFGAVTSGPGKDIRASAERFFAIFMSDKRNPALWFA